VPHYDDTAADTYTFESRRQLDWAPAFGNGAALVATTNIVANASNQDAALTALTVPVAMFGAGLCCAVGAAFLAAKSFENQTSFVFHAREISDTINPEVDRFNNGDEVERAKAGKELERLYRVAAIKKPKMERALQRYKRFQMARKACVLTALAMCVGGFMVLLVGHATGLIRLA
jgi:hypothetical protein